MAVMVVMVSLVVVVVRVWVLFVAVQHGGAEGSGGVWEWRSGWWWWAWHGYCTSNRVEPALTAVGIRRLGKPSWWLGGRRVRVVVEAAFMA